MTYYLVTMYSIAKIPHVIRLRSAKPMRVSSDANPANY